MTENRMSREEQREQKRQRVQNNNIDEKQRVVIPAEEIKSLRDETVHRRVCAYCRVSTDDPAQTTSYELQKQYYEELINNTPGWSFAGIYADEGISGTSLKKRDEFNRMIADCYAGKIDVIVTKSVSRFARNVVDCLTVVRNLAKLNPPIGVKFETEGFYSLDTTSELLLTVLSASAQDESRNKSNAMNWSLEKRFDNGNFLTPVLLGYDHDEDGNLVINPEEAITVRLMYYSYLAGFTLTEISQLLNELNRPSKKGNVNWNPSGVRQILKNERYCGNVLSWKTYTYDFWEHKKRKNKKNRKQVLEIDHHEAIVSHEIYEAVQVKLEMDKYLKDRRGFPTLDVVDGGALRGFVSVNRSCRGFTSEDYVSASESAYPDGEPVHVKSRKDGKIYLDGFEIVRTQFFSMSEKPLMTISNGRITFNTNCLKKFEDVEYVELLFNSVERCIAIRPCDEGSPNAIRWGRMKEGRWVGTTRSISGFAAPLFSVTGWDRENKYRLCGQYLSDGENQMLIFDLSEPEIIRLVQKEIRVIRPEGKAPEETADVDHREFVNAEEGQLAEDPPPDTEIEVISIETCYPQSWEGRFGERQAERQNCWFERISCQGNWEILRPAQIYMTAGGVSESVLEQVRVEAGRLINEMRCAV